MDFSLMSGAAIQLLLLVYWRLNQRFPGISLSGMTVRLFGKIAGRAVNFVYFIFFLGIAGYACTLYARLVHNWLLPLTPDWVILLIILCTCMYLAVKSLRVIARFFVLTAVLFLVPLFLSLLSFTQDIQFSNVFPVGQSRSFLQIMKGSAKVNKKGESSAS